MATIDTAKFNDIVTSESRNPSVTLVGSDKQIEWAKSVRASQIAGLKMLQEQFAAKPAPSKEQAQQAARAFDAIFAETSCRYWIDTRNLRPIDMLRDMMKHLAQGA